MVVKDTAGNFYIVTDIQGVDHAWSGVPAYRTQMGFARKANKKPRLVRKAGCVVVETL